MKHLWTMVLIAGGIAWSAAAAGAELQAEIDAAVRNGAAEIRLARSEYSLSKTVKLQQLRNLVIDGGGARLIVRRSDINAFMLQQCESVTLRNFSVDYDPLPFTQGVVTARDGKQLQIQIDLGYPPMSPAFKVSYLHVFDPSGERWKKNCPDVYGRMKPLSPMSFSFQMREAAPVEVGDRVAVNRRSPAAFRITRCGDLSFCDITVYASPGVAFHGRYGHGKAEFRRIRIIRGGTPAGATSARLLAGCADGINFATSRGGVRVIDCEFSYLGDDGINLHSELLPVAARINPHSIDTLYPYGQYKTHFDEVFQPGDRVRFVRPGDYAVIGEAKLARIVKSPRAAALEARAAEFFPVRGTSGVTCYEVTFDRAVTVPAGSFFYLPSSGCENFEIRGNKFHDHRARGIRIMSSRGVIADNQFERIKHCAISLGGEFGHWREAGWVENVEIRGNRMREIGYGMIDRRDSYVPGVISFFARLDRKSGTYRGNRNNVVVDNVIEDSPGAGIFLYLCEQVTLSGNKISRCASGSGTPGADRGWRGMAPIWSVDSSLSTVKNEVR